MVITELYIVQVCSVVESKDFSDGDGSSYKVTLYIEKNVWFKVL